MAIANGLSPGGDRAAASGARPHKLLCLLSAILLGGCEFQEYGVADEAPGLLVGLSSNDLRLCAGLPERIAGGPGGAQYWSFERSANIGNFSLTQIGVSLSGAEECRVTVELVGERVSRVAFTRMAGSPGLPAMSSCAPLVTTCVEMIRRGRLIRTAPPPAPTPPTPAPPAPATPAPR